MVMHVAFRKDVRVAVSKASSKAIGPDDAASYLTLMLIFQHEIESCCFLSIVFVVGRSGKLTEY